MSSGIPFVDETWEVVTGCPPDRHNEKCRERCWAARMARQRPATHGGLGPGPCPDCDGRGYYLCSCYDAPSNHKGDPCRRCEGKGTLPAIRPVPFSELVLHRDRLSQPVHWEKPRVIFVASRGDLFHEQVPDEFRDQVFSVIARTPRHTYLAFTKRAANMRRYMEGCARGAAETSSGFPWQNLWAIVSVTDQESADHMIRELLATPAAHYGISYEPALGPLNLHSYTLQRAWNRPTDYDSHGVGIEWLDPGPKYIGLGWVVAGCESGADRRPAPHAWLEDMKQQCRDAKIPCYVKQRGDWPDGTGLVDKFPPQPGELPWMLREKRR